MSLYPGNRINGASLSVLDWRSHSGMLVVWYVVIAAIAAGKVYPTAIKALKKNKKLRISLRVLIKHEIYWLLWLVGFILQ